MLNGQLVRSPSANNFFERASIPTGRKLLFGDRSKFEGTRTANAIGAVDDAMQVALKKMVDLQGDKTRVSEIDKHVAAKAIARTLASVAHASKEAIAGEGKTLMAEATAAIQSQFALKPDRAVVYDRIVNWINDKAKDADGPRKIREAMKQDAEIVTVLREMPPYLFDLAPAVRDDVIYGGMVEHAPEHAEKFVQGQSMVELSERYDKAINGIHTSFYNEAITAQAATRVEV